MSEGKQIISNSKIMAAMTSLSRLFGMARDMMISFLIGTTAYSDTWSISFMIPNLFRRLIAEGAMSSALVPLLSELTEQEKEAAAKEFMRAIFSLIMAFSLVVVTLGVLTMPVVLPFLFSILKPLEQGSADFLLMIPPTRLMFPYLIFVSLASVCQGVLNVHNRFALSAATPIFLNIAVISLGWFLRDTWGNPIWSLCLGVLVGGFLQFFLQWAHLWRLGFRLTPTVHLWSPRVKEAVSLWFPTIFSAGIIQINTMVGSIIAANLITGATFAINLSNRLVELVLGVVVASITTSILPVLSRQRARGDKEALNRELWNAAALATLVSFPAAVGLILAGPSVINLIYVRGAFDENSLNLTYAALMFHAMMLVPVSLYRVMGQTYYAYKKVKIVVWIAFASAVINMAGCFVFPRFFPAEMVHAGVPLAALVAAWSLFFISRWFLNKRFQLNPPRTFWVELVKIMIASAAFVPIWISTRGQILGSIELGLRILASIGVYGILVLILKTGSARRLLKGK